MNWFENNEIMTGAAYSSIRRSVSCLAASRNMSSHVEELCRKIVKKQGLVNPNIDIKSGSKKGDGYLGNIYMATITGSGNNQLELIIKSATNDKNLADMYYIREVFENELQFYKEIFPRLSKYQEEKQLSDPFKSVAEYYDSYFDVDIRLIALENLRTKGFQMVDAQLTLDAHHVEKVFEIYGKLHGASFAYRNEHPDEFEMVTSKLHDCWPLFMDIEPLKLMVDQVCKEVSDITSDIDLPGLQERCAKYNSEMAKQLCNYRGRYSTLIHGDCWSNNLMFKYEEGPDGAKKISDIRLLDWQITGIGTPVSDLSYFLYSGSSKEIFDELDRYLRIYHNSLSTTIRNLDGDPEMLYPYSALKSDWMEYSRFGFIHGLYIQRVKLADEVVDLHDVKEDNAENAAKKFLSTNFDTELFKERVRNLVLHMYEIGAL